MVTATKDGLGEIEKFNVKDEFAQWEEEFGQLEISGETTAFPFWAILAIGGGVLAIVLIAVIAVAASRKKRKTAAAHPAYAPGAYPPPAQSPKPAAQNAFCPQCGAPLSSGASFCANCGNKTGI